MENMGLRMDKSLGLLGSTEPKWAPNVVCAGSGMVAGCGDGEGEESVKVTIGGEARLMTMTAAGCSADGTELGRFSFVSGPAVGVASAGLGVAAAGLGFAAELESRCLFDGMSSMSE